jgi:hypothetical protein
VTCRHGWLAARDVGSDPGYGNQVVDDLDDLSVFGGAATVHLGA